MAVLDQVAAAVTMAESNANFMAWCEASVKNATQPESEALSVAGICPGVLPPSVYLQMDSRIAPMPCSQSFPKCLKLAYGDGTEATFFTQGIITALLLSPVLSTLQPRTAVFVKQGITITGLGSSSFLRDIAGINAMLKSLGRDKLVQQRTPGSYDHHHTLTFSSRYFTRCSQFQEDQHTPFSNGIDPEEFLENARLARGRLIHHQDNMVEYGSITYENGKRRCKHVSPSLISRWDLVQVTFAVVLFPPAWSKEEWIPQLVLRSVGHLDSKERMALESRDKEEKLALMLKRSAPLRRPRAFSGDTDTESEPEHIGGHDKRMRMATTAVTDGVRKMELCPPTPPSSSDLV